MEWRAGQSRAYSRGAEFVETLAELHGLLGKPVIMSLRRSGAGDGCEVVTIFGVLERGHDEATSSVPNPPDAIVLSFVDSQTRVCIRPHQFSGAEWTVTDDEPVLVVQLNGVELHIEQPEDL